jgi:hypothetical protein
MNLFLYIQVTNHPEEIKFDNPIITYLKKQSNEIFIYDLDNHSDFFIINNANKLINDSEKTIIYIDAMPDSNFKNLIPLFTNSLDNPDHLQFILQGNNARLEKMLSILTYIKIQENTPINESIEAIIKQFF